MEDGKERVLARELALTSSRTHSLLFVSYFSRSEAKLKTGVSSHNVNVPARDARWHGFYSRFFCDYPGVIFF